MDINQPPMHYNNDFLQTVVPNVLSTAQTEETAETMIVQDANQDLPQTEEKVSLELPKGSVKRIMKLNQDVGTVSTEAIVTTAKATEEFISRLARLSREYALANNRRTVKVEDIIGAIQNQGSKFDFMEGSFGQSSTSLDKK